jgi:hypothetical protein
MKFRGYNTEIIISNCDMKGNMNLRTAFSFLTRETARITKL